MTLQQALSKIKFLTAGEGFFSLNDRLNKWLSTTGLHKGVLHLTCLHTSASLTINENADPTVRIDFETHFNFMVPETANHFLHTLEGSDDMTSHIKSSLLGSSVDIPIKNGSLLLGTWQGIYLCEHRNNGGSRQIVITVNGDE